MGTTAVLSVFHRPSLTSSLCVLLVGGSVFFLTQARCTVLSLALVKSSRKPRRSRSRTRRRSLAAAPTSACCTTVALSTSWSALARRSRPTPTHKSACCISKGGFGALALWRSVSTSVSVYSSAAFSDHRWHIKLGTNRLIFF